MPENTAKPDLAEPVDPISRGWLGCYDGFTVKSAHSVSLDGHGAGLPSETVLSSKDVASRSFFSAVTAFTINVSQHLDEERFVQATNLVLKSYPALGSRDCQWRGSSDDVHFMPAAPFTHGLEVEKALNGQAALFAMRVTELGDRTSVIAVNWLHTLADAKRIGDVLNTLAAAYRGLNSCDHGIRSAHLPQARVERNSWPWHVRQLKLDPEGNHQQEAGADEMKAMYSQDGLLEGSAAVNTIDNSRVLLGPFAVQKDEGSTGWNALVTVQIQKSDVQRLKASLQFHRTLEGVAFSTNDIVLALSWMLKCDATGKGRPGEGPAETSRGAAIVIDASVTWPELAPPGFLGNLILVVPLSVMSDGSAKDDTDRATSLLSALAQTVKAIRSCIVDARKPASLEMAMTTRFEAMLPSATFLVGRQRLKAIGVDMLLSNWNHVGYESMDFGRGPPSSINGYFGMQRLNMIGIIAHSQDAFGIRIPLIEVKALHRLRNSSVFTTLAPQSGLLGGLD